MTIQDNITADQAAVTEAQAALDAANAKLAADQAALAAVQPHLTILDNIEAELAQAEAGIGAGVLAAFDAAKVSVTALIEQMRALFTA